MGQGKLVLVCLVLVKVLLIHAMADHQSQVKPSEVYRVHEKEDEPGWVISREADDREPVQSPAASSETPEIRRLGKHRSSDMSVAGGGVIIGGIFFIAIFASVFAYIRVTRKRVDVKH
ncbi:putative FASCICLIN-like arabinogalactan protein 21 precursor [Hibiscus syriacus]|uniref:FASCICLIN-like arabinogalactan protein 21 n=1 Tax=Hibiscus syriacus TaxID=106335 RepID=A0A6A2Z7Z7_HIBSY|nr:uncharacterized protein LOC120149297 [Hibiscus syriacus]KAE8688104.1 putative FASCICLIN-like arabinogalactan protein 21 precursor [Hibiscus syriacus]